MHLESWLIAVGGTPDCKSRNSEFKSKPGPVTFIQIDHEISCMAILPHIAFKKGQLSVTGLNMYS